MLRAVCEPHYSNEYERFSVSRPGPHRFRVQRTFSIRHLNKEFRFMGRQIQGLNPRYILAEISDGLQIVEPVEDFITRLGTDKVVLECLKIMSHGFSQKDEN